MLIRFLAGAMGQGTDRTLGAQPVRRAVRWLDVLPALVFGTWSQLCFGQEPDCGGGRWAAALADGYVVGTLQRYTEERPTSDDRAMLQTLPAAEMLISTTAGGVFLRTYGGLDVKPEWRSQAHVFLFARHGGSVKTFLRGPLSAAYDARAMAGKACLDRSTVVALLQSKYPRRGCALFRPIIRRLRSHRYQEAIDHLYAMQLDHEKLACLADYVASTSRLQLVSFRVPWDSGFESQYYPPFDSVGALVEMLLYHKLEGVASVEHPQSAGEHEVHRLVWRDVIDAIRVD